MVRTCSQVRSGVKPVLVEIWTASRFEFDAQVDGLPWDRFSPLDHSAWSDDGKVPFPRSSTVTHLQDQHLPQPPTMGPGTEIEPYLRSLPLDRDLLVLDPDTERFFKAETGIQDTEELRTHIIQVQEDAYKVPSSSFHLRAFCTHTHGNGDITFRLSGLSLPLHSCVHFREAQDRKAARLPARLTIIEKSTRRDIFGYRVLQ